MHSFEVAPDSIFGLLWPLPVKEPVAQGYRYPIQLRLVSNHNVHTNIDTIAKPRRSQGDCGCLSISFPGEVPC